MGQDVNRKPTFVTSMDSLIAYELLEQANIGDVVSYSNFKTALGIEVDGSSPHIQYAIKRLLKEGILFENIRGVGYKRLNDHEIVQTAARERGMLRRQAEKSVRRLTCVRDFDALPNDAKIQHNAAVSAFGAIASMISSNGIKKLENTVRTQGQKLSLSKTLEAFRE